MAALCMLVCVCSCANTAVQICVRVTMESTQVVSSFRAMGNFYSSFMLSQHLIALLGTVSV